MSQSTDICKKCGAVLGHNETFCPRCRAPVSKTSGSVPFTERHPTRVLMGGLTLIWVGIFLLLALAGAIPLEAWWAYLIAGLGAALVIGGVLGYSRSQFPSQEAQPAQGRGRPLQSKGSRFSSQLGIEHDTLRGKKILLEFDPSTKYEKVLKDFALEFALNKETVIVLTPSGSVIQHALDGEKGVLIISLAADTMLSPILEKHPERPLALVYDSLSDLALSVDSRAAYRFAQDSLKLLFDKTISAIFLLNPSAHDPTDVSSLRGLFSNQVSYGKQGLNTVKIE